MEKTKTRKLGLKSLNTMMYEEGIVDSDLLASLFTLSNEEFILTDKNFNIQTRNFKVFINKSDNVKSFLDLLKKRKLFEELLFIEKYTLSKTQNIALRLVLPEGKYIKVQITKRFCKNQLCGYLIVMNDYTQEVVRLREKEYFIDTLMHDLKTPARAGERALELLCDGALGKFNTEQMQMLKEILVSSRYMVRMTDNVLAKLKLETEGLVLTKRLNSVKQSVESCINDIKYMLESSNQTIKVNSQLQDDLFVYDEETIKLVLKNLLTNASEYSPKNSTIYITIKNSLHNITISIKDEGKGIDVEKISALLTNPEMYNKRFKKVSSGLGLFISKKILEAHNGSITIKNIPDHGSEVIVKLPFKKQINSDCNMAYK